MRILFNATDVDILQLYKYIFLMPSMHIYEAYSVPDHENRWLKSWEDIADYYHQHSDNGLHAWPESVGGRPYAEYRTFINSDYKGRTILYSPTAIHIIKGEKRHDGFLNYSYISSWTKKGVRKKIIISRKNSGQHRMEKTSYNMPQNKHGNKKYIFSKIIFCLHYA